MFLLGYGLLTNACCVLRLCELYKLLTLLVTCGNQDQSICSDKVVVQQNGLSSVLLMVVEFLCHHYSIRLVARLSKNDLPACNFSEN